MSTDRPGRAPERAARRWLVHAVLIALLLAVVGYLNVRGHEDANASATTGTRIATLRGLLAGERDLQWRALSAGERSLEVARRLGGARAQETALFEELRGGGLVDVDRLEEGVERYHDALDSEVSRITLHRVDQALEVEATQTAPAYAELDRLLTEESTHAVAAARSGHRAADTVLAVALGVVVLLVGALLQRTSAAHQQAQRAATALLAQQREVSESLERGQRVAHRQARQDPLTGLANRLAFAEAVRELERTDDRVAVVFVDLDGFKAVNDRFGHAAGDDVLRTVAARLLDAVRPGDVVARLGGDEFAVLAPVSDACSGADLAGRLGAVLLQPPVCVRGSGAPESPGTVVGASVGHVVGPGRQLEELVRRADAAMYAAKAAGRAGRVSPAAPPGAGSAG